MILGYPLNVKRKVFSVVKHVKLGDTPFGTALVNVNKILDEVAKVAEKEDSLEDILIKIRKEETYQFDFVPGYAGALKAVRIEQ